MKYFLILLFLLGFLYLFLPLPEISMFSSLPNSEKINEANGIIMYYTNDRRNFVTDFYWNDFHNLNCADFKPFNPFCYIKPLKINHSPLLASSYLAPKQKSTYLEEYFYPLRDSIIVNGYEPYDQNGKAFDKYSKPLVVTGKQFNSEVTVRYYSPSVFSRIFIYLLIWACIFFEVILFRKILKYD